jgi:hypothetical protein
MDDRLNERLARAFPPSCDAEIIRAVSEGVFLADDLIAHTPLLKTVVGRDLRGHIRRAGVMFRVQGLCERGDLPFKAEMVRMPFGNWHWLEIKSDRFKAHICRTLGPYEFPNETLSRQDARLVNQGDLFLDNTISLDEVAGRLQELYAWLAFGISRAGKLEHLCWAMPPADEGDWLAHVDVMKRLSDKKDIPADSVSTASPSPAVKLRFKRHIEEQLADQKNKEKGKK